MVYILLQGQPLDAFSGAVPESQLRQMVAQLLSATPEGQEVIHSIEEAKKLLAEGKAEDALQHFEALLQEDSQNIEAITGAASALIALGALDEAEAMLARIPEANRQQESVISAATALKLARNAPDAQAVIELNARLAKNEHDHQARFDLASALFASGEQEAAIAELLHIMAKDKNWNEGAARTKLLEFFEALGHTHPLTMQGRRKLSTILFS
jgi:putative thioredoxin